jgi:hypothetical protein
MQIFSSQLTSESKRRAPWAHRLRLADDYAWRVMDVYEIRHANLLALVEELRARRVTKRMDQAQQLGGLGSSFLSQLLGGKKIGDDVARKIDEAAGKPRGWLDRVHSSEEVPTRIAEPSQAVRDYRRILAAVMRLTHDVRDRALEPITDAIEMAIGEAALDVVMEVGPDPILDGSGIADASRRVAAIMRSR